MKSQVSVQSRHFTNQDIVSIKEFRQPRHWVNQGIESTNALHQPSHYDDQGITPTKALRQPRHFVNQGITTNKTLRQPRHHTNQASTNQEPSIYDNQDIYTKDIYVYLVDLLTPQVTRKSLNDEQRKRISRYLPTYINLKKTTLHITLIIFDLKRQGDFIQFQPINYTWNRTSQEWRHKNKKVIQS